MGEKDITKRLTLIFHLLLEVDDQSDGEEDEDDVDQGPGEGGEVNHGSDRSISDQAIEKESDFKEVSSDHLKDYEGTVTLKSFEHLLHVDELLHDQVARVRGQDFQLL